jgi:hypothetical protein
MYEVWSHKNNTIWEAAVLVLLKGGIYEARRWDGLRCHDIYTNTNIMFLDIIHRPVFISKHRPLLYLKKIVSETAIYLHLSVKPTQLGPIPISSPDIGNNSIDSAQMSRFYLKAETESNFRNVVFRKINRTVFLDNDRTMDNVQKHNNCTDVQLSQNFISYIYIYIYIYIYTKCNKDWFRHSKGVGGYKYIHTYVHTHTHTARWYQKPTFILFFQNKGSTLKM